MRKRMIEVVKIGKGGELTLPRKVRSALGLQEGDEVMLVVGEKKVTLERRVRGFSGYLDVMMSPAEDEPRPVEPPPRRGLARFLIK